MKRFFAAVAGLAAAFVCLPATAATISIVSMRYSDAHPVPHLHYEGDTLDGDVATLSGMFESFVKCRIECSGPEGMPTAVLTMNGPGGSYYEGLKLADFLRANHIATVVERGMYCYSACAFAFLGGSAFSSQAGIGTYIDRMVEPGSSVGFHAPYADEQSFLAALEARGAMQAQGQTRDSLALMVKELVKWNVDPEVMFYMVGMGPDDTYQLKTADDLYLARVALPPTPTSAWINDLPDAVKNVCTRLLAIDERADPLEMRDRFLSEWTPGIGQTEYSGPTSGYKLGERVLDIGNCAATDQSLATEGDYEVALYYTPGLKGFNAPGVSFFNRQEGWSSAGTGGNPVKRILQKGPMNHYFLPMGIDIDELDLPGEEAIDENRFVMRFPPPLPLMAEGLVVDDTRPTTRISHSGNIWVFERLGPAALMQSVQSGPTHGRSTTIDITANDVHLREGTFERTGSPFFTVGMSSGPFAVAIDILHIGGFATAEDIAEMNRIKCAIVFGVTTVGCV